MSDDDKKKKDDTGWKKPTNLTGDGDRSAQGVIELDTGTETKPCYLCRSWEKDEHKLIQHLMSMGLEANPDGSFTSPIAKDVHGESLKIHPKAWGYCRKQSYPTEDLASCEHWVQVRFASELASRIAK